MSTFEAFQLFLDIAWSASLFGFSTGMMYVLFVSWSKGR